MRTRRRSGRDSVAFVLGGGGHLGAYQVGMLRALLERDIAPDLVLGTSIGAINGAVAAAQPGPGAIDEMTRVWQDVAGSDMLGGSVLRQITTLARTGTHLHSAGPLRSLLQRFLGDACIEDLPVRFQCVAASIERASEHWFERGSVVDAVLASCSVPGALPPMRIGQEHFIDGGIVNSIPVGRAVALGATTIYVLQVGRVDSVLRPPRYPWEVGLIAFEVARRHRYMHDLATVPDTVSVHVLPTGVNRPPRFNDWQNFRYRDFKQTSARIDQAYRASGVYLDGVTAPGE
ncbi:MAG: patatin-like phospholipase family protein [Candidatus Dormibacteria bacterium]